MVAVLKPNAAELRSNVLGELASNAVFDDASIVVDVDDGTVRLSGIVDCYAKKLAAQRVSSGVFGVRNVIDDIVVEPDRHPGVFDIHLARAVRHLLEWHYLGFARKGIEAGVVDGVVFLRGRVGTLSERAELERAISQLVGVRAVRNDVAVVTTPVEPSLLRDAVAAALARVLGSAASRVEVTVVGRAVMLMGTVRSLAERRACVEEVGHIPGVASLEDHLSVE
jgi:osmotically-inducible protein OsmY